MSKPTLTMLAALIVSVAPAAQAADDLAPGPSLATQATDGIRVLYNGYFLGFRVMKADVRATLDGDSYQSEAVFRTAGLAGMFKDSRIEASVNGEVNGHGIEPGHYEHRNLASSKNRLIQIDFTPDDVVPTITPPFGSMGQPPATHDERMGTFDPVSAFLTISLEGGDAPCERTVPVFDSKQRYDLRLEPVAFERIDVRGFDGEGWHCNVYYDPVSGFDPEDLADPEDYARPMQIWLADLGDGRWAPVRVRARVSGVPVSVEAKRVELSDSDQRRRAESDDDSDRG